MISSTYTIIFWTVCFKLVSEMFIHQENTSLLFQDIKHLPKELLRVLSFKNLKHLGPILSLANDDRCTAAVSSLAKRPVWHTDIPQDFHFTVSDAQSLFRMYNYHSLFFFPSCLGKNTFIYTYEFYFVVCFFSPQFSSLSHWDNSCVVLNCLLG